MITILSCMAQNLNYKTRRRNQIIEKEELTMKKILYFALPIMFLVSNAYANDVISALDADKDNMVNMEEAKILPELLAQFEALDKNKDNMIDATEILEYHKAQ